MIKAYISMSYTNIFTWHIWDCSTIYVGMTILFHKLTKETCTAVYSHIWLNHSFSPLEGFEH